MESVRVSGVRGEQSVVDGGGVGGRIWEVLTEPWIWLHV